MPQYREYTQTISATDTEFVLKAQIGSIINQTVVTRGGSEETDFKAATWAQLQLILTNAPAGSTAQACSVVSTNKLSKFFASGTFSTQTTTIKVPTGNPGDIQFRFDPGAFSLTYVKNGGSAVALTDSDIVTFADGDTLSLNISGAVAQELYSGDLSDVETGQKIDLFQLMNTTP